MKRSRRVAFAAAGLVLALLLPSDEARPQSVAAQSSPRLAEEVYKNIQVLKGMPAGEMGPIMEFFRTALGEGCAQCHVSEQYPLEDKPAKQVARQMIQMTLAINKNNYGGRAVVTCYTCHRGSPKPVGMFPPVAPEPNPTRNEAAEVGAKQPGGMPTVDQILDRFVAALGGAGAIQKISSRVQKGTVTDALGRKFPMEILAKTPEKRISVLHLGTGDVFWLYDGDLGWNRTAGEAESGSQPHDIRREDLDQAKLEDPLWWAGRAKQIFRDLRVERTEKVEGHPVYVVSGHKEGPEGAVALVELYFDQTSELLNRLTYSGKSPFGGVPIFQFQYGDYRNVDGVKLPFRWTVDLARAGAAQHFTYEVEEVRQNIPIEDSKFVVPATLKCIPPRCSGPTSFSNPGAN